MEKTLAWRLKLSREQAKKTQKDVAKTLGVSVGTISGYERGYRRPEPDTLAKLAQMYGVSTDYLIYGAVFGGQNTQEFSDKIPLSDNVEGRNINRKKGWNVERSQHVIGQALKMMRDEVPIGDSDLLPIPVLGTIRAGYDLYADQQVVDYLVLPRSMVAEGEHFCLLVQGESMAGDGIHDGDKVLVRRQEYVEEGKIGVILVNGYEATLKRIQLQGDMAILIPSNTEFQTQLVPLSDVMIQGQVTQHIRTL